MASFLPKPQLLAKATSIQSVPFQMSVKVSSRPRVRESSASWTLAPSLMVTVLMLFIPCRIKIVPTVEPLAMAVLRLSVTGPEGLSRKKLRDGFSVDPSLGEIVVELRL